jgi:hypothetical protein
MRVAVVRYWITEGHHCSFLGNEGGGTGGVVGESNLAWNGVKGLKSKLRSEGRRKETGRKETNSRPAPIWRGVTYRYPSWAWGRSIEIPAHLLLASL